MMTGVIDFSLKVDGVTQKLIDFGPQMLIDFWPKS